MENINRLMSSIEEYAKYGSDQSGGITRPSFSDADRQVRELFIGELKDLGLSIQIDAAGNIWGKLKGNGKKNGSIVIGSHLDTVPNGGKFDGSLGVLMAKEMIQSLLENHIVLNHDIEIVSFTAEESNDFNLSTFGSRFFVGKLTAEMIKDVQDSNGNKIIDKIQTVGGDFYQYPIMKELRKEKKVFLELHIEQGQRLERNHIPIGIVDKIVGTYRSNIKVTGNANHSGTTLMEFRQDALAASAEMILAVESYCKNDQNGVVGTVGKLNVFPNAANIIPGEVDFILEIRGVTEEKIKKAIKVIGEKWGEIEKRRNIRIQQNMFFNQNPVSMNKEIIGILQNTAQELNQPYVTLPSMAVHDAANMAQVSKTAMIFVKSINGKSHCPEELSLPEDIKVAKEVMYEAIIRIDSILE